MADDAVGASVLEVGADGTTFEAAISKMTRTATEFERKAVEAANRSATAVSGVGDGAAQVATKQDAASKRFVASLEREIAQITLTRAEYRRWQAEQSGIAESVYAPLIQRLDQATAAQKRLAAANTDITRTLGLVGVSAGQATAALRTVPAQLTDIATQIAGGQNPLLILLQQGGQLKDSFGGVGNAVKALGSFITPTALAIGGATAVVGGLAAAFLNGAEEASEFRKALTLTGGIAGTTAGQLQVTAAAVAQSVGTQGKAAEIIAALASTGRVAAADLGKLTEAAVRLERVGGPAVKETVAAFADLGRSPLDAARKLNESSHFLTLATLEQIRALEEQGRTAEAARVAQSAYADTAIQRSRDLESQLGGLETAWKNVGDAAKFAWDRVLDIGREQTLPQRLASLQTQLDIASRLSEGSGTGLVAVLAERFAGGVREERRSVNRGAINAAEAAAERREVALLVEAYDKARSANQKWTDAALTNQEKTAKALADYRRNLETINAGRARQGLLPVSAEQVAREEAAIRSSVKAQHDAYGPLLRDIEAITAATRARIAAGGELTKAQELETSLNKKITDTLKDQTPARVAAARAKAEEAVAEQARLDAMLAEIKAAQQLANARADLRRREETDIANDEKARRDQAAAALQSVRDRIQQFADEERAVTLASHLNITLAEAIERVGIARLRERQANKVDGSTEFREIESEIAARERLLDQIRSKTFREAQAESQRRVEDAERQSIESWQRTTDEIGSLLRAAIVGNGRDAFDTLIDYARNAFAQPFITPFAQGISTFAQSIVGGPQAGGGSSLSWFSAGKSLYDGFSTGFGNVGANFSNAYGRFATSGAGQQLGMSTLVEDAAGNVYFQQTASSTATGSTIGSAASAIAGAIAGHYLGRGISGGYAAPGSESGNSYVNAGTAIGAIIGSIFPAIGTAIGAAAGGALGGVINRAIGFKPAEVESREIVGSFSNRGDFSGDAVMNLLERGGWFRSDRRSQDATAITGDLDLALDEGGRKIADLAQKYGAALGLPIDELASVTQQIRVTVTENAADNSKAIADALTAYGDALLESFADDLEPFRGAGETVAQTIERVGGALLGVNDIFDTLGLSALETSVAGGEAALKLLDLFGGADAFAQSASQYYERFYSEAERADRATQALTETLGQFGLALPANRDAFRDLVEAQDRTTDSGRAAFAALLQVAGAFDEVQKTAEAAAEKAAELARRQAEAEAERLADLREAFFSTADRAQNAFLSPEQLAAKQFQQITDSLGAVGVDIPLDVILGATKQQIYDFALAFTLAGENSIEAKIAVLEAAEALAGLKDAAAEAEVDRLQGEIDELVKVFGDFSVLNPVKTISEQFTEAKSEFERLQQGLDTILGRTAKSVQEVLSDLLQSQRALQQYRTGALADAIENARLGTLTPQGRIAARKATEASLFSQLSSASDPVSIAQRLTSVITDRVREEAELSTKLYDDQISALERLRDLSKELRQFTDEQRIGDDSPLSFEEQLNTARSLFERTLADARSGDADAQGRLTGNARTFLDEARAYYASGSAYGQIFSQVTSSLDALGLQGANVDPQITELQTLRAAVDDGSESIYTALVQVDSRLGVRDAMYASDIAKQTEIAEKQLAKAGEVVEKLEAQLVQGAEAYKKLIAEQQAINATLRSGVRAAELDRARG